MADDIDSSSYFTFNGGRYRPVIDNLRHRSNRPRPAPTGEWTHIPYGGNVFESDGSRLHTTWSTRIVCPTTADFEKIDARYRQFGTLTRPEGEHSTETETARLAQLNMHPTTDGTWEGEVTWEWA